MMPVARAFLCAASAWSAGAIAPASKPLSTPTPAPTPAAPTPTPPPAPAPASATFSAGFSDHVVLQRAPEQAAVYGIATAGGSITVTLRDVSSGQEEQYTAHVMASNEWKVLLTPKAAGGNYTIEAACTTGCESSAVASLTDVTFGDVWFCSGQSNMELIMQHTFSRNKSIDAIKRGKYHNLRIYLHPYIDADVPQWTQPIKAREPLQMQWNTATMAVEKQVEIRDYQHPAGMMAALTQFSAACYYFGQALTDRMLEAGQEPVPLGLMGVSWGGSMVEQWMTNETTAECQNTSQGANNGKHFNGMVGPFANTTVKGWLWYQGENNIGRGTSNPNSAKASGYACQFPKMIDLWRRTWSATPGTTNRFAPFGVVDLAAGTSEGKGGDGAMGNFRWAQSGSYGVLPNPLMPATFMANAYDLGDPWNKGCYDKQCCTTWACNMTHVDPKCSGDRRWDYSGTTWYMGPIHARPKELVGERLAMGAWNAVYGGDGALSGPVIAGCHYDGSTKSLTVSFNNTLLKGDVIQVKPYNSTLQASAMQVLQAETMGPEGWIAQKTGRADTNWTYVDFKASGPRSITVDLSHLADEVVVGGLRYAWEDRSGCGDLDMNYAPCPPASYPLVAQNSQLPAMPFLVRLDAGRCECIAPQVCDEVPPAAGMTTVVA